MRRADVKRSPENNQKGFDARQNRLSEIRNKYVSKYLVPFALSWYDFLDPIAISSSFVSGLLICPLQVLKLRFRHPKKTSKVIEGRGGGRRECKKKTADINSE